MSQGKENLACTCGCKTFFITRVYFGDHVNSPGTADTINVCSACGKIWTPEAAACTHKWDTCDARFSCPNGEECWYSSDEFKHSMDDL